MTFPVMFYKKGRELTNIPHNFTTKHYFLLNIR